MRYVNLKTGATVDCEFRIKGENWVEESEQEEVEEQETSDSKEQEEIDHEEAPDNADEMYEQITVAQIKQELDAFGIEYDSRATKPTLYELMKNHDK